MRPDGLVVTDNSNFHFGIYAGLKTKASFLNKYHAHIDLFFEHRGTSYGANDLDNIVWFPNISFSFQDTFRIFEQQFEIDFHAGNKNKHQIGNGLKIYNVDDQSFNTKITHKRFYFQYNQIADLSNGIGLNISEYFQFTLGFENNFFKTSVYHSLMHTDPSDYHEWGLTANYSINENYELFFQGGIRNFEGYNIQNNSAFVLGANCQLIDNDKIIWNLDPSIRYYTANYNLYHADYRITYRELGRRNYGNTVGRYLYPLRNYYYDFDQYAVFTEYQREDILGLGLKTNFKYKLYTKFFVNAQIETLTIHRSEKLHTNYFYSLDVYYRPTKGLKLGLLMSNKTYNLDIHYPTFYMMEIPLFGLNIKIDLKEQKK